MTNPAYAKNHRIRHNVEQIGLTRRLTKINTNKTIAQICNSIDPEEVVGLTKKLVSIESHVHTEQKEEKVALYLRDFMKDFGCEVSLQRVRKNRPNLIATLPGKTGDSTLMFNGHMDTVPPGEMKSPFTPSVQDGKLYGRGSTDMKGAVAAMAIAMKHIAEFDVQPTGNLALVTTVDEEIQAIGMDHFVKHREFTPDYCLVGEPTSLDIGIAHKGIEKVSIETKGKSVHGSTPQKGVNAINHMAKIIQYITEELSPQLTERRDPDLGSPTLNIGTIEGGDQVNIVPSRCKIEIDRRWIPGESVTSIMDEFKQAIEDVKEKEDSLEAVVSRLEETSKVWHGPFRATNAEPLINAVSEAVHEYTRTIPEQVGLNYWTDGALVSREGIPTLIFGPGKLAKAHTADEYVEIEKLVNSARIYCQVGLELCK